MRLCASPGTGSFGTGSRQSAPSAPLPADVSAGGRLSPPPTYRHTHDLQSLVHLCIVLFPTSCWGAEVWGPRWAVTIHEWRAARARRWGCDADGRCPLCHSILGLRPAKPALWSYQRPPGGSLDDYFPFPSLGLIVGVFQSMHDGGASAAPDVSEITLADCRFLPAHNLFCARPSAFLLWRCPLRILCSPWFV